MRLKLWVLLVLCGVSVQACGDDEGPVKPGRSVGDGSDGGNEGGIFLPIGDGDGDGDDDDGGAEMDSGQNADAGDAGSGPTRCDTFDAVPPGTDPNPDMNFNLVSSPTDLAVTRASATWDADCTDPTLIVTLSSGNCPNGDGHELTFFVPAEGVEDRTIVLGQNVIADDEPGHIRVRYTRPSRLTVNGEWGTCAGAMGAVDLIHQIELIEGRRFEGNFMLDLTRCDGGGDPSLQAVEGQFNVEIPATLDDLCP